MNNNSPNFIYRVYFWIQWIIIQRKAKTKKLHRIRRKKHCQFKIDKQPRNELGMDWYTDYWGSRDWRSLAAAVRYQCWLQFVPKEGPRRRWKQFHSSSRVSTTLFTEIGKWVFKCSYFVPTSRYRSGGYEYSLTPSGRKWIKFETYFKIFTKKKTFTVSAFQQISRAPLTSLTRNRQLTQRWSHRGSDKIDLY